MKKLVIVMATAATVGTIAFAVRLGSLSHRRAVIEREFLARGLQMVEGCNGGAAVQAEGQVYSIKQYLDELSDFTSKDTNMVTQLQRALIVAQEKAQVLSEDCCRRGHCETHPWKTNWVTVKEALAAFEKSN